jgi:hypothetical protein
MGRKNAQHLRGTYATVTKLTTEAEEQCHKLHVDNFFSSPALSDDLTKKKLLHGCELQCNRSSARKVMRKVSINCQKCEIHLCADKNCFLDYHTKIQLQNFWKSTPYSNLKPPMVMGNFKFRNFWVFSIYLCN